MFIFFKYSISFSLLLHYLWLQKVKELSAVITQSAHRGEGVQMGPLPYNYHIPVNLKKNICQYVRNVQCHAYSIL